MSYQPVTDGQMKCAKKMAIEKGISRNCFQQELDNGGFARYLDYLKYGGIVRPPDARIHLLPNIEVVLDQGWQEALNTGGLKTPTDYSVCRVGHLYPPAGLCRVVRDYVLLSFDKGDGFEKALAWAKEQRLENTVPREAFAVGQHYPTLYGMTRQNPMYVIATTECSFEGDSQACFASWLGPQRAAGMTKVSLLDIRRDWFLFRKPSVLAT